MTIPDGEQVVDGQGRPEPPLRSDELATLRGFLDFQRATLEWKTRGLDDEQLRRGLHPTRLTLGGLLHHLAWVEEHWFGQVLGGLPAGEPWAGADFSADPDWEVTSADRLPGELLRGRWTQAVARSDEQLEGLLAAPSGPDPLATTRPAWGGRDQVSVRWVLTHMVEEYSRHNGHADLLREAVDGQVGE